jgi:hypothetical protein
VATQSFTTLNNKKCFISHTCKTCQKFCEIDTCLDFFKSEVEKELLRDQVLDIHVDDLKHGLLQMGPVVLKQDANDLKRV